MKSTRSCLLLTLLLLVLNPAFGQTLTKSKKEVHIRIAVTTDVHGAFFPTDWYSGKPLGGSLAQVSEWACQQRKDPGQTLILLDNGDLIQGDPATYYSNFIDTGKTNIAARILNYMGYGAGSVGNHDLETGHPVYDKLKKEFGFPWLSANSVTTGTNEPWFKPYVILEQQGIKIAVLGLTTPKIPDWLPPALWTGMEFRDMITTAAKWTELIRIKEKPDLLVGLFHAGVDPTYGMQDPAKPLNENAARLVAEQIPGFDVVFTGHDHRTWNFRTAGPSGDSVLIIGSESRASEIAVADFTLTRKGGSWIAKPATGSHVDIKDIPVDPVFMEKFGAFADSVKTWVDQPVGTISQSISSDRAWTGPSEFTGLIHRAQLDLTGADVSFTAPLSFRATIPQGPLAIKDLFKLYRFENQLYTINLTGAEILGYLNFSYSLWMRTMAGPDDLMLNMEQQADGSWRFNNAYYNFDSAAGIDYTVDLSRPAGQMVSILRITGGAPFDITKTYRVAVNSYRGSGGGGHLVKGAGLPKEEVPGRLVSASDMDFRYLLGEWIRKQGTVNPVSMNNWKTLPAEWSAVAGPRDLKRLFPAK